MTRMKPQIKASGQFVDGTKKANYRNIPIFIISEDDTKIFYGPVFDLSGYGHSEQEARQSLVTGINEFFKYTMHKNTLENELLKLGWKQPKKKKFIPPAMSDMVKERDYFSEIMNEHDFRKESMDFEVPA